MTLTGVVVDDEYLALNVLREYALRTPQLSIVKTFVQPQEALAFLEGQSVDLLFLDIQMPFLSGFELLRQLTKPPMVIFTTARHDYAARAFDLDVVDYLVKPIAFDRFAKAVSKAAEYAEWKLGRASSSSNYIMVQADYKMVKIPTADIIYVEGFGEYVKIFTHEKMIISLMPLKTLLGKLPGHEFIRVHKSYIISKKNVVSYSHQYIKLSNNKELPVGRVYKPDFVKQFESQ